MKKRTKSTDLRRVTAALAVAAVAATHALSAGAVSLPFSQNVGFYGGPTTLFPTYTVEQATLWSVIDFGPALAGKGGLEFFTATNPALAPANTWGAIAWGCLLANAIPANCANPPLAAPVNAFPGGVFNPAAAGRSSLEVAGGTATQLDEGVWTPVTIVQHHNHDIDGTSNVLSSVDILSYLRLNGVIVDNFPSLDPSITGVAFTETPNIAGSCIGPAGGPVNPLGSDCDDYATVAGIDLAPIVLPQGTPFNPLSVDLRIDFRINPTSPGAMVCGGLAPPDPRCGGYAGTDLLIYTAEDGNNSFQIEARLTPLTPENPIPLFVVGDCEYDQAKLKKGDTPPADNNLREVGDPVNYWGAQWWKNNCMSLFVSNGYPSFKGYATRALVDADGSPNCGQWQARPGNSGHPPAVIPDVIDVIVTDNVIKDGPNIGGNIKQIVRVNRKVPNVGDNYGPNPGHRGYGTITEIVCGPRSAG